MGNIDAKKIKELREITQAGFLDCKKALEETNGDIESSIKLLREKGVAKAEKKSDASALEGITDIIIDQNKAVIFELNSQTDFVAKNDIFVNLVDQLKKVLINAKTNDIDEVRKMPLNSSETINEACTNATAKIGEKISLRRIEILNKENIQSFGSYVHHNKRYSVLVLFDNQVNNEVAKNIAMHIGAMNPKFLDNNSVDQQWLNEEKKILIEKTIAEGKPNEFAEKIVNGRLSKLLAEYCLVDQQYVKEPTKTVSQYLKENKSNVIYFTRFELGDGLAKPENNFADEVAQQIKK